MGPFEWKTQVVALINKFISGSRGFSSGKKLAGCLLFGSRWSTRFSSFTWGTVSYFSSMFLSSKCYALEVVSCSSLVLNRRHGELVNRPNFSWKPWGNRRQGELLTQGPGWFGFYRAPKSKLYEQNVPQLNKILSQSLKKDFHIKTYKSYMLIAYRML